MGGKSFQHRAARRTKFEQLECRQMLTASPVSGGVEQHAADFWYDTIDLDAPLDRIEQTLASANELTGLARAASDYGFQGLGQTVAVIDSGIAWDHPNLGGGFGAGNRVVGGWDFTEENDANPYDDGPAGSHGTHVAGIIGASANGQGDVGVASGVDLVGLRVFNDRGEGYFSWVEKALRWVHDNRNSFANPITAINLSLGTAWNAANVPNWATLEDEFALLESDGIFIAVSAGNSFTSYNAPGLSYPAVSEQVVPVMSVDDTGSLSYFSQRHARAIAAPGRSIRSTVPDYVGNQNNRTDDWANFSGTSMASPYVAGASVLVREAMQFVGMTNITQDIIFSHLMSTADVIYDAATNANYNRLNLGAALDALMPADDFGSTVDQAFDLGVLDSAGAATSGLIGKRSDIDYFRFTASVTGTATFTADANNQLAANWLGAGLASEDGASYTIQVVAGQSYVVGLGTASGIGYFDLTVACQSSFDFVDWGAITQASIHGVTASGDSWYRLTASQSGYLTAEAFYAGDNCQIEIAWYDTNLRLVATAAGGADSQRVDRLVSAGEQLFLRVSGSSEQVDFRLTNLVALGDGGWLISGTDGDDTLAFTAGATHDIAVNGVTYSFDAALAHTFRIDGGTGRDTITMRGAATNDVATLRAGNITLIGSGYSVAALGVENVQLDGGGGNDVATLYDTPDNDLLTGAAFHVTLTGGGYVHEVNRFARTTVHAVAGGNDRVAFQDTAGDDVLAAWSNRVAMYGTGYFNDTYGFSRSASRSTAGGNDRAVFYDTAGDDVFAAWSNRAAMYSAGYFHEGFGFGKATAHATAGGNDRAVFYDTPGDDVFAAWWNRTVLYGTGYFNEANGFDRTTANATTGYDRAVFYDTAVNDVYAAWSNRAAMYANGYFNEAWNFDTTTAQATQGFDRAVFYDSAGDDLYAAWADRATMTGRGYFNEARGFDMTTAYATLGNDRATLYDSSQDDTVRAAAWGACLSSNGFANEAQGFDWIEAISSGGNDTQNRATIDYLFNLVGEWN